MTNNMPSQAEIDEEIDLWDLLLVLADNLKLLILTPIVFGLVGIGAAYLIPPTFESTSVYAPQKSQNRTTPELVASYLQAPAALREAGRALNIQPDLSDARLAKALATRVTVSIGKQDKLVTLTTKGRTAAQAQALNQKLWQLAMAASVPQGPDLERLHTQITAEQERFTSGLALEKQMAEQLQKGDASETTARLYGELLAANSTRFNAITALQAQLEGLTEAGFTHPPSLPEDPAQPKKALIVIAATLAGGFLALLFAFMRHALRTAATHPVQATKIAQIRKHLGLRPKH